MDGHKINFLFCLLNYNIKESLYGKLFRIIQTDHRFINRYGAQRNFKLLRNVFSELTDISGDG